MILVALLSSILTVAPQFAVAWSGKAHEEIEEAAVQLLIEQNHPLAGLFSRNLASLKAFGAIPDTDWPLKKLTKGAGKHAESSTRVCREEGLHTFQVDAFLRLGTADNAILALPDGDYSVVREQYRALLRDNVAYLLQMGRSQSDPTDYGTAPWRVLQLFRLGVQGLKSADLPATLSALGLASHYLLLRSAAESRCRRERTQRFPRHRREHGRRRGHDPRARLAPHGRGGRNDRPPMERRL
jgi:hypothetical protein